MTALPSIMLAPNGARRGRADHPVFPLTISETAEAIREAGMTGADGLHLHVRNSEGRRSLDTGLQREAPSELAATSSDLAIQITTKAGGQNSPEQPIAIVDEIAPANATVAPRELRPTGSRTVAVAALQRRAEQGTAVQHVPCGADDLEALLGLLGAETVARFQLLFVRGSYSPELPAAPEDPEGFLAISRSLPSAPDRAACEVGAQEAHCLVAAHQAGGNVRIGLKNNVANADRWTAAHNASRVADLREAISRIESQASE